MKLPKRRSPEIFQIGKHGYIIMRLDDLDDILRGAEFTLSLKEITKEYLEKGKRYKEIFKI